MINSQLQMAMKQLIPPDNKYFRLLQQIDLAGLHPVAGQDRQGMLAASRASVASVLQDFLTIKELTDDRLSVIDGFLFIFNDPVFARWHTMNWWEQRRLVQGIKDHEQYNARARALLSKSCLSSYIGYSDDMVAKSTDQQVKRAWMRKRLVLQECFWNTIDSVSHAAYHKKKYRNLFPALCLLLCNVTAKDDARDTELLLGVDNGTGFLYKKKSRESSLFRLLYKAYKLLFRGGVFYIGGLELGLLETESELSCHGSGAVVYQGW